MDSPGSRSSANSDDTFALMDRLRDATSLRLKSALEQMENMPPKKGDAEIQDLVKKQQVLLERLHEPAFFIGTVVAINGDQKKEGSSINVSFNGRIIETRAVLGIELKPGDFVRLFPSSCQIAGLSERFDLGSICTVRKIIDTKFSEVDLGGSVRAVLNGMFSEKIETDDRVVLDSSGSIIIAKLGKSERKFDFGVKPSVTWDDIVGLDDAKAELREVIEMPSANPDLFKYYGQKTIKSVFVFGPPGCGKTMLGEAVATSMAKIHGDEALETGYFYVKGPEFHDMFVGVGEKALRKMFEMGERHFENRGFPAVIFIDESDALLPRRGSGVSTDVEKTMVTTFLSVMNKTHSFVILATNRPDEMDPAVIRHGRGGDRKIWVTRPSRDNAEIILEKNFRKYPLYPAGATAIDFAKFAAEEFYSASRFLSDDTLPLKNGGTIRFTLSDIVNGAMLSESITGRSVSIARRRDETAKTFTGITREDIKKAVDDTYREEKKLDHKDEIREFVDRIRTGLDAQAMRQVTKP